MATTGNGARAKNTGEKNGNGGEKIPPKTASSYVNLTIRRDEYRRRSHFI